MTLYTLADIPKLAGEAGVVENRAHHFGGFRSPIGVEAIAIPKLAQLPSGRYRHREPELHVVSLAPCRRVSFRPEEENRGSGVADVVPEPARGHDEMDDAVSIVIIDQLAASEGELHRLAAFGRASGNARIEAQERWDGDGFPRAVAPIGNVRGFHAERRRHRRERMRHPNVFRRRRESECFVLHFESSQRRFDILDRARARARDIVEGRGRAGTGKMLVNEKSNVPIQVFQLNASWNGRSVDSSDSRGTELMNGLTIQRKAMGTVRLRLMDSHSTMTPSGTCWNLQ